MTNPWKTILPEIYEGHMRSPSVNQYNLLNKLFKEQVASHEFDSVAILGVGCGNGIEHICSDKVIWGYDINPYFLDLCGKRFCGHFPNIHLIEVDLTCSDLTIHDCDILICNLVIEYIGLDKFIRIILKNRPKIVSVIIQQTDESYNIVSHSPFSNSFLPIYSCMKEFTKENLIHAMCDCNYSTIMYNEYTLKRRMFIRIDFSCTNI